MRISELVISVMGRLGNIPGLRFLHGYITSAEGMKTRFGQRKGDFEGFIGQGAGAMDDIRKAKRGARGGGDEDDEDFDEEYDEEYEDEFEEDYYDQYDDSVSSSQGSYDPVDDYPASDEDNSYFDDDYRR